MCKKKLEETEENLGHVCKGEIDGNCEEKLGICRGVKECEEKLEEGERRNRVCVQKV